LPRYNLAHAFLSRGEYGVGWLLYEARRSVLRLPDHQRSLAYPEWRGESLQGRRIVVFGEQGFGDQIMFARFLPELERHGAEAIFLASPEVAPLFPSAVSAFRTSAPADYWAHLGSLPLWLHRGAIPPPADLRLALSGGGGVGVVPSGSANHRNPAVRSLDTAAAARILALGRDLRPEATGAADFRETAEIMAGLDLVISVDTAAAHLSASLGKPTWVLLPAHGVDWRWGPSGETTPWYPVARLFRQAAIGDWDLVLSQVERDVQSWMKTASTAPGPPGAPVRPPAPGVPPRGTMLPPPSPPL
jgi:hypothetical protein